MAQQFGPRVVIHASQIFCKSKHSFGFVNISPIVPGHLLVSSKRVVKRVQDLRSEEFSDLMLLSQRVGMMAEACFKGTSLTLSIQDGPDSGQTVPHVHVHVIPRRKGDFERGDELHEQIEKWKSGHEKEAQAEEVRKRRTTEEMAQEAKMLRKMWREEETLQRAEEELEEHMRGVEEGHGVGHARKVLGHARRALAWQEPPLTRGKRMAVLLAALLHDADDRKFFGEEAAATLSNAKRIARSALHKTREKEKETDWQEEEEEEEEDEIVDAEIEERIGKMIGLVSASKNKEDAPAGAAEWELLARWSDRLEAIGREGIVRCYDYNCSVGAPLYLPSTPRVVSRAQLSAVAPPHRFLAYSGASASMIDHYYDKLVHVASIPSSNSYLVSQAALRQNDVFEFLFEFGRTGVVDQDVINRWRPL